MPGASASPETLQGVSCLGRGGTRHPLSRDGGGALASPRSGGSGGALTRHLLRNAPKPGGVSGAGSERPDGVQGRESQPVVDGRARERGRVSLKRQANDGLPDFCDVDSLRNVLDYLSAAELARFALTSRAAKEVAMAKACALIVRR